VGLGLGLCDHFECWLAIFEMGVEWRCAAVIDMNVGGALDVYHRFALF